MIAREVLQDIPPDEFLVAADQTFEDAPRLDKISRVEKNVLAVQFKAINSLASYLYLRSMYYSKGRYGADMGVGVRRFGLALNEYFDIQNDQCYMDKSQISALMWIKGLKAEYLKKTARSYLQQEEHEGRFTDEDGAPCVPWEVDRVEEEYPAFSAFDELLGDRLTEAGVNEDRAERITCGSQVASVVLRETIEMADFSRQINYVATENG